MLPFESSVFLHVPGEKTESITDERPARNTLRLETAYFDEVGSEPEVLERRHVRIGIDVVAEGILTRQGAIREEVQHDDSEGAFA